MSGKKYLLFVLLLITVFVLTGCFKRKPQAEIDAAEASMKGLEATKDCAPETYMSAKTMMERAQALLKEERYDEAKNSLLAARNLAKKAKAECEKKKKEEEEAAKLKKDVEEQPVAREIEVPKGPKEMVIVYFAFNESTITDEAQAALANNAEFLRQKDTVRVRLGGHCDSRGSTEYNLALGERRAMSVKNYMVKLGISPDRLKIISYGEESPAYFEESEDAWAKNRRAEFLEIK